MIFFNPNETMVTWLIEYANKRHIMDIGAGDGHLVKSINQQCPDKAIGIDLLNLDPTVPVYQLDATRSEIISKCKPNFLLLMCRPCHGWWIEQTLKRIPSDVEVLYIGLPKNVEDDLWGFDYEIVDHLGSSTDNEVVYKILEND
jgi:hypothetical protein